MSEMFIKKEAVNHARFVRWKVIKDQRVEGDEFVILEREGGGKRRRVLKHVFESDYVRSLQP